MVVPRVTVPAILDLCFPAGLCSIKGLEIEGLESSRKTELLQITRLRTSPRSGVLAGEDGELSDLPCAFKHSLGLDL